MARGTALVADVGHVMRLTAQTGLMNLSAGVSGGELNLPDLLVTASDTIFDRLEVDGVRPEDLLLAAKYERAVAYQFLALLAGRGLLRAKDESPQEALDRFQGMADRMYEQVKPRHTSGSSGPSTREGLPAVWNPGDTEPTRYWEGL